MVIWYLLVTIAGTQPQVSAYPTEQKVCEAFAATPGSHVYLVSGHRDTPTIAEGECKPVQSFIPHK